ncbi:voltage-dependent calcium channel subunit alpha-2/delta-3 isoform X1 [Hydra vulgaris]|uniref:voltage-dependent calcium channel subunit alpha-2/delta-3 isoform X1 n=1 Tax=Hydra vulgaris TaxID=6087 RepID=UPI001F5F015B|nr:voltage-dependent calcium channel subunit alpha-2/delta-3 isoform X1 [Hydra vulgaris]
MPLVLTIIVFSTALTGIHSQSIQSNEIEPKLKQAAIIFSQVLDFHLNKLTNYKKLNEIFRNVSNIAKYNKTNGQEILDKFANDIEKIFSKKKVLLKNLEKNVVNLRNNYTYDPKIERFDYLSSRFVNNSNNKNSIVKIVKEFPTDVPINQSESFVHVPTNIYEYNKYTLNTVRWTEPLNKVFKDNEKSKENNDSSVVLQYFCDASGLLRMYPGNLNGLNDTNVDLFDCRRRLWYQQSAASPKDVVILIDNSGSMTGTNIVIAKIAAKSIIDTLDENDYFNVIFAGEDPSMVSNCANYLIQATKFNKEKIKLAMNKFNDQKGVLNIEKGVEKAFKTLNSGLEYNRTYSSRCNKIILFFSDGIEGDYSNTAKSFFDKWNNDKSVRVFTYLVGRTKNPNDRVLKEMACNNRGHFYQIQTLGNVWDTVIQYLEVLSRPIVQHKGDVQPKISPVYLDSSGAGMILTMSLGVFNSTNLVGVVGLDMLIRALTQLAPISELGYFSHTVIINSNGFIVQHPKYLDQTGYLPLPTNVYFEDLEYSVNKPDSKNLKNSILKGESSSIRFLTYWLYDNNTKIAENNVTYYYKPVLNSTLFVSLAISDVDINNVTLKNLDKTNTALYYMGIEALKVFDDLNYYTYVDIPNWRFCNNSANRGDATLDLKVYPNASELQDYLKNVDKNEVLNIDSPLCNTELTLDLLINAALVIGPVTDSWQAYVNNQNSKDPNFKSVFVCTGAGYTRYFSLNNQSHIRDSLRTSVFEKAVAMPDFSIIASSPVRSVFNDDVFFIQILASTWMENNGERILMAVTGAEINSGFLRDLLNNATNSIGRDCSKNDSITCALIDQNGFILVSNQGTRSIGKFFGQYHSKVMKFFVEKGIFKQINLVDHQASCSESIYNDSAANFFLTPAKIILGTLNWLLSSVWRLIVQAVVFAVQILLKKSTIVSSQNANSINISCTKNMIFFLFQNTMWNKFYNEEIYRKTTMERSETLLRVPCSAFTVQYFSLTPVPNTNLLFIIVDSPSDSNCNTPMNLVEDIDQQTEFCQQNESFRTYPSICYSDSVSDEEKPEFCGKCDQFHSSVVLIFVLLTILVFF